MLGIIGLAGWPESSKIAFLGSLPLPTTATAAGYRTSCSLPHHLKTPRPSAHRNATRGCWQRVKRQRACGTQHRASTSIGHLMSCPCIFLCVSISMLHYLPISHDCLFEFLGNVSNGMSGHRVVPFNGHTLPWSSLPGEATCACACACICACTCACACTCTCTCTCASVPSLDYCLR